MSEATRRHALVRRAETLMAEAHHEMRRGNVNLANEQLRVAARAFRAAGKEADATVAEHLLQRQRGTETVLMAEKEMAKEHFDHAAR